MPFYDRVANCSRAARPACRSWATAITSNKQRRACFQSPVPVLFRALGWTGTGRSYPGGGGFGFLWRWRSREWGVWLHSRPPQAPTSGGRGRPTLMLEPAPARAAAVLLEVSRSLCGPQICLAVDAAATLSKGAARRGRGEALAHARVAVGGCDRRMRVFSQKPGTLRGARPNSRAHACASRGFPACASCQSRPGACARYLRPTRVAGFPPLQAPAPAPPPPSPQSTRPFPLLAEWGRRCSGSRARDAARARSRAVSDCRARAALRSPSVTGAEGSVKRRRQWFLFPFLPLPSVGSSISTQPPLPLPQRWAAAAEGCGGGDWGTAETASAPASGKGAFGGRAPRTSGSVAGQARDLMRLQGCDWRLSLLFSRRRFPGLLLQLLLLIQRLREKWGGSPRDALAGVFEQPGGCGLVGWGAPAAPTGTRSGAADAASGIAHPCLGQGPKPRKEEGMGAGWELSLFSIPACPFSSHSVPVVTGCGEEDTCTLGAFERGSQARNRGVDQYNDPL